MSKKSAIIVDLDGTLAIHNGRRPYEYHKCDTDLPNAPVVALVRAMDCRVDEIIFLSGREDSCYDLTRAWICKHVSPLHVDSPLFMRATGDYRKDALVKREIYEEQIAPEYDVLFVLDDRDQVVNMWREKLGLTCLQVAPGNF